MSNQSHVNRVMKVYDLIQSALLNRYPNGLMPNKMKQKKKRRKDEIKMLTTNVAQIESYANLCRCGENFLYQSFALLHISVGLQAVLGLHDKLFRFSLSISPFEGRKPLAEFR